MGEYDRNANPLPLRVQTDFKHHRDLMEEGEVEESEQGRHRTSSLPDNGNPHQKGLSGSATAFPDGEPTRYIIVPQGARLFKGQSRVALAFPPHMQHPIHAFSQEQQEQQEQEWVERGVYEIVLHQGEAYLAELPVDLEHSISGTDGMYVAGYSTGWRHSIVLLGTKPKETHSESQLV